MEFLFYEGLDCKEVVGFVYLVDSNGEFGWENGSFGWRGGGIFYWYKLEGD